MRSIRRNSVATKFDRDIVPREASLAPRRTTRRTKGRRPLVKSGRTPHIRVVIVQERHPHKTSDYAAAIARWEDEGGAPIFFSRWKERAVLGEEGKILEYLGAAVIMRWRTLPTKLQRELFEHAASLAELGQTTELRGQIARLLHNQS
jgi:hypothetical protein